MIKMKGISKSYRVRARQSGMKNAVKGLFSRSYTEIQALRDMTFTIPDGRKSSAISDPMVREKAPPSKFSLVF